MVRLPARLRRRLAKARIAQIFNSAPADPLLQCVDPAEVLHLRSHPPVSREKMHALMKSAAPAIWIGGSEPLLHSGIGHLVRAIAHSGHCVFLETDGTALRRRIHEFQPIREVFLTVRLNSVRARESALAVEGLRAARLSGFLTAIQSPVRDESDLAELATIRAFIAEKDVDGWLITAASSDEAVVRKVTDARGLIRSAFWRQLSEHVEQALHSQAPPRGLRSEQSFVPEAVHTEAGEESMRIA